VAIGLTLASSDEGKIEGAVRFLSWAYADDESSLTFISPVV
jgi:hypothetical protein